MLRVGVLVPDGGTDLQAISDVVDYDDTTNVKISIVISNNPGAHAPERARKHGIRAVCTFSKQFPAGDVSSQTFPAKIDEYDLDLVALAGFLAMIPVAMTEKYRGHIVNVHPPLIPSLCGMGYYRLKVHKTTSTHDMKVAGAAVHYVGGGVDTDLIIPQKVMKAEEGDTPEILQRRVIEQAEQVTLPGAISTIANGQ